MCEVDLLRLDGQRLTHAGGFEDIVDESEQHVAVAADDADELEALFGVVDHLQQVAEAYDGIERCTNLVGHIGEEGTLQLAGILGTCRLLTQLFLCRHELRDVARHTEEIDELPVVVELGHAADREPAGLVLQRCVCVLVDEVEGLLLGNALAYLDDFAGAGLLGYTLHELVDGLAVFGHMGLAREVDEVGLRVVGPHEYLALFQEVAQSLVVAADGLVGLHELALVFALLPVHVALGRHVTCGDDVEGELVVLVVEGHELVFDILVEACLAEFRMLADVERLAAVGVELALDGRYVEEVGVAKKVLALFVEVAQVTHFLVGLEQAAVLAVERHGEDVGFEQQLVLGSKVLVVGLLHDFARDVLDGMDDVARLAVLAFQQGVALKIPPVGIVLRPHIPTAIHAQVLYLARCQHGNLFAEFFALTGVDTADELVDGYSAAGYQTAMSVLDYPGAYVVLGHIVGTHAQRLQHHTVEVGTFADGSADADGDETAEEESHQTGHYQTGYDVGCPWRGVVMLALGMEPAVVDRLDGACLFESGKLFVNEADDVVVVTDDAQLASGKVYLVKGKAVDGQLLNLTFQG